MHRVLLAPKRMRPMPSSFLERSSSSPALISLKADRMCEYNSSPSSVRITPFELLKKRVMPSSSSSCLIALLTAGWLMNSRFEAAERLPVCAVVRNIL